MVNFVFENLENSRNFINNWQTNSAGADRFTVAPIFNRVNVFHHNKEKFKDVLQQYSIENKPDKYIIAIGGNNNPNHWAGGNYWNRPEYGHPKPHPSFFEFINQTYLEDLKNNKAFLLMDSSFEGYHDDFIFNFFHDECIKYEICPSRIIFVSGNSIIKERYRIWLMFNPQEKNINVIPHSHFENDVYLNSLDINSNIPSFEKQYEYKSLNLDKIKIYSNLNKKQREHRVFFYSLLYSNNLLDDGLVSMNEVPVGNRLYCGTTMSRKLTENFTKTLPSLIYEQSNEIYDPGFYINRIHPQVYLDSWVSVISEARFEDEEGTVFLSEKIFKPIACNHPFMVMGNRNSLIELKKLGYETFSNFFDESYDSQTNFYRMESIIKTLKDIKKIKNKLSWFKDMEKILKYNYEVLRYNVMEDLPNTFKEIQKIYYDDY